MRKYNWEFWAVPKLSTKDVRLNSEERLTLGVLTTMMNGENRAWPSHKTLSEKLGCSIRSVTRHVAHLESHGWISVNRDGESKRVSDYELFVPPKGFDPDNLSPCQECPVTLTKAAKKALSSIRKEQLKEQLGASPVLEKEKLQLLRDTVESYKKVKGFDRIAGWDKTNFPMNTKYAKQLVGLVRENFKNVSDWNESDIIVDVRDCIDAFQRWGEVTGLSWNLATMVRRFGEYMQGTLDQEVKSRQTKKQKAYA